MSKKTKCEFKEVIDENIAYNEQSIDLTKLPDNEVKTKKSYKKVWIPVLASVCGVFVILPLTLLALVMIDVDDSVKSTKRKLSRNEVEVALSNTFERVNEFDYPENDPHISLPISESELTAYNNFVYDSFNSIQKTKNFGYSPITYYSVLNQLALASSRTDLDIKFDNLLNATASERIAFYAKVFQNNYFYAEEGTTKLHNGAFFNNKFQYNQAYVDQLTNLYTECFNMSFNDNTAVNKMLKWVNDAVEEDNFIDKQFLNIDSNTALFLFSTLYFDHTWNKKYDKKETQKQDFYFTPFDSEKLDFMQHSYFANSYYDYGNYISFKDYYSYGESVTYIVPKSTSDNIYDLINGVNFLVENPNNVVLPEEYSRIEIKLSMPKFNYDNTIDLKSSLINLGIDDVFADGYQDGSFNKAFDSSANVKTYLQSIKQKNAVSFSEDGTTAKSVTMGTMGATNAGPIETDVLEVSLNQPFIYIIKDKQNVPLFMGTFDGK